MSGEIHRFGLRTAPDVGKLGNLGRQFEDRRDFCMIQAMAIAAPAAPKIKEIIKCRSGETAR